MTFKLSQNDLKLKKLQEDFDKEFAEHTKLQNELADNFKNLEMINKELKEDLRTSQEDLAKSQKEAEDAKSELKTSEAFLAQLEEEIECLQEAQRAELIGEARQVAEAQADEGGNLPGTPENPFNIAQEPAELPKYTAKPCFYPSARPSTQPAQLGETLSASAQPRTNLLTQAIREDVRDQGVATPAPSTIPNQPSAAQATTTNTNTGKKVHERIHMGGWPTIKTFRLWKLAFKKAVAAASARPDEAYVWICAVEDAQSTDELADSGEFVELDALLATEWDKLMPGDFKRQVQAKEYELAKQKKMLKGRQTTWLVYHKFRISDLDTSMLNWEELNKVELKMPGDNIQQFLTDWDTTIANVEQMPDAPFIESMFRKQLERSKILEPVMALYWQGITQLREQKDYTRLRNIVENFLEERELRRNQQGLASGGPGRAGAYPAAGGNPDAPKKGTCRQWKKKGKCADGKSCPWAASHTPENKPKPRGSSASSGKGKGKSRGRSKERRGSRGNEKSSSRGSTPNKGNKKVKPRGKSPSGEDDRPLCYRYAKDQCTDSNCRYFHPKDCTKFKFGKGVCEQGRNCKFRHLDKEKAKARAASAESGAKAKAKAKAKAEAEASARVARLPLRFLLDPSSSIPSGARKELSSGRPDASERPLALQLREKKKVKFGKEEYAKSMRDEKTPLYQPKNSDFIPHRTNADGTVRFDEAEDIEQYEHHARRKAIILREKVLGEEVDEDTFYCGSTERKVYSMKPPKLQQTKAEKRKARKKAKKLKPGETQEQVEAVAAPSFESKSSPSGPKPRRYIVDSGASFHLVDPGTLSRRERNTIEDLDEPIPLDTANGEVNVTQRCRVFIAELSIYVWAFLHEDTVCCLSLGLLVERMGFRFEWSPGQAPQLIGTDKDGARRVQCYPHYNVPFIHTSKARGNPNADIEPLGSNKPTIYPRTSKPRSEEGGSFQEIMSKEMKGLEDLIPGDAGASSSSDDAGREADADDGMLPPPPVPEGAAGGNPLRSGRPKRLCG